MRITTGIYKGRALAVPPGDRIRPTSDRMRQAIFNILLQYGLPAGARVIDGFCGSGALGLEALSRGAAHVTFIDTDTACCAANVATLKAQDRARIIRRDVREPGAADGAADLLFLDPPYGCGLLAPALTALAENGWLAPGAVCVSETEKAHAGDAPAAFLPLDRRAYGAASLLIHRYRP